MNDLEKIKQIVDDSPNIDIFPSPDFRKDSFSAALALLYSLKKMGKNANLIARRYPEKFSFLAKKEAGLIRGPAPDQAVLLPEANFLISIKEAQARIAKLFYEKTRDGLNLFLKTNGGKINQEDVTLKPFAKPEKTENAENALIAIGIEKPLVIEENLDVVPGLIVNIDNQTSNEGYGKVNIIERESATLCEIVFDILCFLDQTLIDKEIAEILLTGIIEGTSIFQDERTNAQTLEKAGCLMEKGADLKETISQLRVFATPKELRLFGKILTNINISKNQGLAWALLSQDDFSQTQTFPSDLKFTLQKLVSGIFPFQHFLCLWEETLSEKSVKGIFYSPERKLLEKVLTNFKGEQKGQGVLFQTQMDDLEKAKNEIIDFLCEGKHPEW